MIFCGDNEIDYYLEPRQRSLGSSKQEVYTCRDKSCPRRWTSQEGYFDFDGGNRMNEPACPVHNNPMGIQFRSDTLAKYLCAVEECKESMDMPVELVARKPGHRRWLSGLNHTSADTAP